MQDMFNRMALDALLAGLHHLRDSADRTIHEIEHAKNGTLPPLIKKQAQALLEAPLPRRGRPLKAGRLGSGWSADPAERKREMARRQEVARAKRKKKPRGGAAIKDKETWRENVRKAAKAAWERLSPAERKAKIARVQAGRRKPRVKMEAA